MDFLQLQTDTIDLLGALTDIPDYSLTQVKHYINRGYFDFCSLTEIASQIFLFTTTANQFVYTKTQWTDIENAIKVFEARYEEDATESSLGTVLKPFPGGMGALPKNIETGTPKFYALGNWFTPGKKVFILWPVPSTTGKNIKINASTLPDTELVADNDTLIIPEQWHDAISYYAAWRMFSKYSHRNPSWRRKALENKNFYEQKVLEAKQLSFFDSHDDSMVVRDVYDVY